MLPSAIHLQYQELKLINQLNEFYDFDHNIFLLDSTVDHDRYVNIFLSTFNSEFGKYTPQSVYTFDNGQGQKFTHIELSYLNEITSKNTFLIVAVENVNFDNKSTILSEFEGLLVSKNVKIGVFFAGNITTMDTIKKLFRWSWSVGIVNIFCTFYTNREQNAGSSLNVFRFDPFCEAFDSNDLINVTLSDSHHQNCFPDKLPNYHGHPLRILQVQTIEPSNLEVNFWGTVVRVFNASMLHAYVNEADYYYWNGLIKADINQYETSMPEDKQIYPHRMAAVVLLVPHAQPYSGFMAYLQSKTWKLLFAYTFLVVATASMILTVSGYLKTKKILFLQRFTDVVNLLINDNGAIKYRQLHRADVCLIVPLTFIGFIMMNGILSAFQSYLALPMYD